MKRFVIAVALAVAAPASAFASCSAGVSADLHGMLLFNLSCQFL